MSTGEASRRRGRGALWVVGVVAVVGLLMAIIGTAVLGAQGARYLVSVAGSEVLDLTPGFGTAEVEPGLTYGLLVPAGSDAACRVWEPDGSRVDLRTDGTTFSLETPRGRWSGNQSFTAPASGTVVVACESASPVRQAAVGTASVRLVAAPDWSLGPALALVLLVVLGCVLFGTAAVALVVVLVRRHGGGPRPPRPPAPPWSPPAGPPGPPSPAAP
jgi:hypothetical protein